MLVFQILVIPLALVLSVTGAIRFVQGERGRWIALARSLLWLAVATAVWRPDLTTRIAQALGIGRGADLVLYALALAFLAAVFYFYRKSRQLESDLTRLARHIALAEATNASAESAPGREDGEREQGGASRDSTS